MKLFVFNFLFIGFLLVFVVAFVNNSDCNILKWQLSWVIFVSWIHLKHLFYTNLENLFVLVVNWKVYR